MDDDNKPEQHIPLTREEMIAKMEALFRETQDPAEAVKLGQLIVKWRGLDMEAVEDEEAIVSKEDRKFLENLINDARPDRN